MSYDQRNCKEYCWLRKCCYTKGRIGQDPTECPDAWYIEEHMDQERYDHDKEDEADDEY